MQANFVASSLAAKWRLVLSLLSTLGFLTSSRVVRCKDRDLTRIDDQDTVVAGLQAAIVTAFEWILERVNEWPCFRDPLFQLPRHSSCSYEVSFPRSAQQYFEPGANEDDLMGVCFHYRWQENARHTRKLALVGIIPNQILFSFSSDKDRRTDSRIRRKNTAQPRRESNPGSCEF